MLAKSPSHKVFIILEKTYFNEKKQKNIHLNHTFPYFILLLR